jgi:hypothetical protein
MILFYNMISQQQYSFVAPTYHDLIFNIISQQQYFNYYSILRSNYRLHPLAGVGSSYISFKLSRYST